MFALFERCSLCWPILTFNVLFTGLPLAFADIWIGRGFEYAKSAGAAQEAIR